MDTGSPDSEAGQPAEARSLAEAVGAMSDSGLAALFAQRPDLARPLPEDVAALAQRAATPGSVRLAWLRLNALQQQVLEVLVAIGRPVAAGEVVGAMDPGADAAAAVAVATALEQCRALALVWQSRAGLTPVQVLSGRVGATPCGLDPVDRSHMPRIARYLADPAALDAELESAPPGTRRALDRLLWQTPRGSLPDAERAVSAATARTPVEWLLARDLLVPEGPDTVVLPREIALMLRRGRYVRRIALPPPPPVRPSAAAVADADATGGMHALAATRLAGRMLALLEEGTTRVLRSGGVYQRDAADLARRLRIDAATTALTADLLLRAGLIAADHETGTWALTRSADAWRVLPEPRQWAVLVLAWRDSPALTPRAAATEAEHRILSDALDTPGIAEIRRLLLAVADGAPAGQPLDPGLLATGVTWRRPLLDGRDLPSFVADVMADAEALGVLGRSALTGSGRLLADPEVGPDALAAAVCWPRLVDRLVLQADLTATALGPLTPQAMAGIERLADLESSGAGTVYRFSPASVQRAFDAGLSTGEVLGELTELSLTGLPGPLEALVGDVGRRHGAVRVAAAACVITSDDDAALSAALADRSLARLRLHRVAAGVAISPLAPAEVTAALRRAGVMAVSASPAAPQRRRLAAGPVLATPARDDMSAAVRAVRAGSEAMRALTGPARIGAVGPHELVDTLQAAIRDRNPVWLDVTDATGTRRIRHVQPLTLRSGVLSGFDQREHRVLGFPLSRIAGLAVIPNAPGGSTTQ